MVLSKKFGLLPFIGSKLLFHREVVRNHKVAAAFHNYREHTSLALQFFHKKKKFRL